MTTLSLADWLNFSVASIEAEKTFIGLGPGVALLSPDKKLDRFNQKCCLYNLCNPTNLGMVSPPSGEGVIHYRPALL